MAAGEPVSLATTTKLRESAREIGSAVDPLFEEQPDLRRRRLVSEAQGTTMKLQRALRLALSAPPNASPAGRLS